MRLSSSSSPPHEGLTAALFMHDTMHALQVDRRHDVDLARLSSASEAAQGALADLRANR
jgi:hypothetical protein